MKQTLRFLRVAVTLLVVGVMTGCSVVETLLINSQNIYIKTDTIEGVIFNANAINPEYIKYFIYDEGNRNPDSYWTPTEDDVLTLEEKLPAYLQSKLKPEHYAYGVWDKLPDYKRQYVGFVIDGNKAIYASYFCDAYDSDAWKTQLLMVMDGGECFFQIIYDVEKQTFRQLAINGFA
jgi:uncharacterized protein YceK